MPVPKGTTTRKPARKTPTKTAAKVTRSSCSDKEWKAYNRGYNYAKRVVKAGGRL